MATKTEKRPTAAAAVKRLREFGDAGDALFLQRFFKTGPGEYGAGDRFLGVRLPSTRRVAREFRDLPLAEMELLLHEPWHEARLLGVILLGDAYHRGTVAEREKIFRLYVRNAKRVNNWDLVDASAAHVVGRHLFDGPRTLLDKLARSENLWERRIAIIATHHFIRQGQHDDTIRISRALMRDEHDLIHKATGWMLREMGKRDSARLEAFLEQHAHEMPRTMLRYAIERMTPAQRRRFMDAKRVAELKTKPEKSSKR